MKTVQVTLTGYILRETREIPKLLYVPDWLRQTEGWDE